MESTLKVLFLAAEAEPFIKIGGLGDVAGSLPPTLRHLSVDIRLVLPLHGEIRRLGLPLQKVCDFGLPARDGEIPVEVLSIEQQGVQVYFIESSFIPEGAPVYSGDNQADGRKYLFFSLAALQLPVELDWQIDILHANDWHTAVAVYALGIRRKKSAFFRRTASVLSVHNLPYLGGEASSTLDELGLPPAVHPALPVWARTMPLPLGLFAADRILAVSPTYAKEILTPAYGSGLHLFLQTRAACIGGILNGLDNERWNPHADEFLERRYNAEALELRTENRAALQRATDLPDAPEAILMGMVNRMDYQKGVDLVPEALFRLPLLFREPASSWQLIVLGTGDPKIEAETRKLELDFPGRVRVINRFDNPLSHLMYGGTDIMLIPSRYEPCGLTQMIAMRYGCVPLARATGGLCDTVYDYNRSQDSTGFLFEEPSPEALLGALVRAMRVYRERSRWRSLQLRGMRQDFSWEKSAREYLRVYLSLIEEREATGEPLSKGLSAS